MPTFAELLKQLRADAGLSQAQLAQKAGIHKRAVAKLEYAEREPSLETADRIARALGISLSRFDGLTFGTEAAPEPAPRGRPKKMPAAEPAKKAKKKGKVT
jgi:transcriptional regulator with XRE-family HTH domain